MDGCTKSIFNEICLVGDSGGFVRCAPWSGRLVTPDRIPSESRSRTMKIIVDICLSGHYINKAPVLDRGTPQTTMT